MTDSYSFASYIGCAQCGYKVPIEQKSTLFEHLKSTGHKDEFFAANPNNTGMATILYKGSITKVTKCSKCGEIK